MAGSSPVAAARWMVAVMISVVLSFVVATLLRAHFATAFVTDADDLVRNALPSVHVLSAARGSLHRLEHDIVRGAPAATIDAERQDIESALATYIALPFFPSEQGLYTHVTDGLAALDRVRAAYAGAPDREKLAAVERDIDIVDQALERVISFDAAQGQRLGLEIEHVRAEARGWATGLDGATLALALAAAVLALRNLRRAARERQDEVRAHERREAELAAKNEALGQFAGRVAHDVLSPLGAAMLSLDLVRQSCASDRAATRALERGVAAVHRVHALVDGLLAFARAGGHPEPGDSTELAPVIADVVDGLAEQARAGQIALRLAPVPDGRAACSAGVLQSLVSNLVRNAIKYMGDASERRIDVRVGDAGERWRVEVSDTGPGIPEDQQQRIFEPYVQIQRGGGGIGLGLATVDRLSRAHGGAVGVQSQPGRGATFWFELPKPRLAAVEHAAQVAS